LQTLYPIAALLLSVFLLIAGNSLIGVVAPVRADLAGFGDLTIGLLGSAYFAGMLLGTLKTPVIVRRVGHIRAFTAFVAIAIVAIDIMPVWAAPGTWLVSRALLGFAFSGIYAVIESWIHAKASNTNRGALYGVYQIVNFVASASGQLLPRGLDPNAFVPFTIGASLFALGIVPLAMTRADAPEAPRSVSLRLSRLLDLSPISVAAALAAGAANGAAFALAPIYALGIGVKPSAVPLFTVAIVFGSAVGVYPAGWLSDRIDRRAIMALVMTAGAAFEVALASLEPVGVPLAALGFCVGLATYTLYARRFARQRSGQDGRDGARFRRIAVRLLPGSDHGAAVGFPGDARVRTLGSLRPERDRPWRVGRPRALEPRRRRAIDGEGPLAHSLATVMSGAKGFFMPMT
jgi:MFS family permease